MYRRTTRVDVFQLANQIGSGVYVFILIGVDKQPELWYNEGMKERNKMNNQLKQLNDELTNCRKAIAQAVVLSGQGVLPRLRRMENNIILDMQKLAIKFPFIKSTTEKIIENRG